MKITLIGAAGVRTPLLVHGLAGAGQNMKLDELALWDIDRERLAVMGRSRNSWGSKAVSLPA